MLLSCLKCREKTVSENPRTAKTNKGKLIILSKCAVYDAKRLEIYQEPRS